MSNLPSDTRHFFRHKPARPSNGIDTIVSATGVGLGWRGMEQAFELPNRLFEQLPFAIYVCDLDGLVVRYNRRAAELWGRSPKLGDPSERFCGSYRMFRPDGSLLPHHQCPMAEVLYTGVSIRQQEVHIERPDGSRGIALVDIEAIRDGDEIIIGAVNCFQDITERKLAQERETMLACEADHRGKNLLAVVQAAVHLTNADTVKDFKAAIDGRIQALANVQSLLAQSLWAGVDLHSLVMGELAPYRAVETTRAEIGGPTLTFESKSAQSIAIILHELTTNAVKYGSLSVPSGRLRVEWSRGETDIVIRWSEMDGPIVKPPSHQGFGTRLVGPLIQTGLAGKVRYDWNPDGLACEIIIPLAHVVGGRGNASIGSP